VIADIEFWLTEASGGDAPPSFASALGSGELRRAGGRPNILQQHIRQNAHEVRLPNMWWRCRESNPGPTC